ncbi:hypothetical protein HPP92_017381 [Vanilla planifolia]|uniref:NADP-dependent oxidoreductase domain-containing protein n=1 Tax=Vanilla planifolia TaxID=51239 RepID=A0A835UNJ2_VANPL|nr:hypothetical protein HPP92_017381 [Vanilla planifolia]
MVLFAISFYLSCGINNARTGQGADPPVKSISFVLTQREWAPPQANEEARHFKLAGGHIIPAVGLGTCKLGSQASDSVFTAVTQKTLGELRIDYIDLYLILNCQIQKTQFVLLIVSKFPSVSIGHSG